jgi:hypothetical protein
MNFFNSIINNCLFLTFTASLFAGCSTTDSTSSNYSRWDFSGSVVDATDNKGLNKAVITYQDASGKIVEKETDKDGYFYIEELPYGTRSFTFSYKKISKKDTLYYSPKTVSISSTNESSHMEGVVAGNSSIVRLAPINASFKGELYFYDESAGKKLPVSGVKLNIIHQNADFINIFPETFSSKTDSTGKFTFKKLPADTGFILQVSPYTYNKLRYTANDIVLPKLKSNFEIDLGRYILNQDTIIKPKTPIKASNVMDINMNGYNGISTLATPYYVFSESITDKNMSISVKADTATFYVKPTISGDTLFLKHDLAFPAETKIAVNITAYKKKSGDRISLELKGDSAFTTDRGLYAVTSNAWPSNKKFKSTFGTKDTIWVKFSEKLDENTERIQWSYVNGMARSIYANGYYANAKSWIKQDTLFVQMMDKILESRAQGDSVGMSVTVYAKNEMYLKGFTLRTELKVPASSSSSAVSSSSAKAAVSSSSSNAASSSSTAVSSSSSK